VRESGIPEVLQIILPSIVAGVLVMLVTVGPFGRLEFWPFMGALAAVCVVTWFATQRVIRNRK
jgi:hypothetical protein